MHQPNPSNPNPSPNLNLNHNPNNGDNNERHVGDTGDAASQSSRRDDYSGAAAIVQNLQTRLADRADADYAEWYRHNVKPATPVRGVRMQDLRHLVMAWHHDWQHARHPNAQPVSLPLQLDVTFALFRADFVDDRLAAMVFLDEVLIPSHQATPHLLPRLSSLFPPGLISDFKACDHFAAKVLQPLLIRYGAHVSHHLRLWFRADSVWQARAALSALTPLASDAIYDDLLYDGCAVVVARPEEEAKSIVGSALRAWGKVRPELVEAFLRNDHNLVNTNAPCLNKATSFLEPGRAQHFREQRRMLLAWNAQSDLATSDPTTAPSTAASAASTASSAPAAPAAGISAGAAMSMAMAVGGVSRGRIGRHEGATRRRRRAGRHGRMAGGAGGEREDADGVDDAARGGPRDSNG